MDQNGDPAPGLSVGITPYRSYTYWVGDHEMWGDEDPRKGFISRHLPTAPSYKGCFPLSSSAWVWEGDGCRTVTPVNGTADLGVFQVYRRPEIRFYTYDRQGHIIEGASVRITGPNGFATTVMDAASGGSLNGILHVVQLRPARHEHHGRDAFLARGLRDRRAGDEAAHEARATMRRPRTTAARRAGIRPGFRRFRLAARASIRSTPRRASATARGTPQTRTAMRPTRGCPR